MTKEINGLIVTNNSEEYYSIGMADIDTYNQNVMKMQKKNCGYYIIEPRFHTAVDNKETLNEIYELIKAE